MKQFFKFTLASILGIIIGGFLFVILLVWIFSSTMSLNEKTKTSIPTNSVLHIKLDYPITDRGGYNAEFNFASNFSDSFFDKQAGLIDILENIEKAKFDDNIKGIFLDLNEVQAGVASTQEIREALADFKSSGKFIISYAENYSQKGYYLASVADEVFINPQGFILFKGINAQITFFKNLLDKLGVEAQIIRHGKYKSAIEPFVMDHMSQANKEQTSKFIQSIWDSMIKSIATSRSLTTAEINKIADELLLQSADAAIKYRFVDKKLYLDQVYVYLKEKSGLEVSKKIALVSMNDYVDVPVSTRKRLPKDKIAVIFAQGEIVDGSGSGQKITSEKTAEMIRKARKDKSIKAIVLRVNSPGGSALASDVIWRETILAKAEKPLVVSMGDVAASGGYYISCAADKIFANETTITGSIGVFGMIPNLKKLLNEKVGLDYDQVKTNENAGFISLNRPLTEFERNVLQKNVERTYGEFIGKVAKGRAITVQQVDNIGQGRVWSGVDAKPIRLIDAFGGLNDAIAEAAKLAKIEDNAYRLRKYPEVKDPFTTIMDELNDDHGHKKVKQLLGPFYKQYEALQQINEMKGIQTRLPFTISLD